jgi:hypothetical protein
MPTFTPLFSARECIDFIHAKSAHIGLTFWLINVLRIEMFDIQLSL